MKAGAIVVFVLAGLSTLATVYNVFIDRANRPGRAEDLVGYTVGSFLVPLALLILGSWMWRKAQRGRVVVVRSRTTED